MKELGFGNKRVYVMTKEEHDKLEALISSIYADSTIVYNNVRLNVAESNVDEYTKRTMMEITKDICDNTRTVFSAI